MKKSRWIEPYTGKKTNATATQNRSGVYLIRKKGDPKIRYVGFSSSNLYRTMYRHFQSWDDPKQIRVTYPKKGFEIRIILCTPKQAKALEEVLRKKYKPSDNPQPLGFDFSFDDYHKIVEAREKETKVSADEDFDLPF